MTASGGYRRPCGGAPSGWSLRRSGHAALSAPAGHALTASLWMRSPGRDRQRRCCCPVAAAFDSGVGLDIVAASLQERRPARQRARDRNRGQSARPIGTLMTIAVGRKRAQGQADRPPPSPKHRIQTIRGARAIRAQNAARPSSEEGFILSAERREASCRAHKQLIGTRVDGGPAATYATILRMHRHFRELLDRSSPCSQLV
jgi:hypothetical protein